MGNNLQKKERKGITCPPPSVREDAYILYTKIVFRHRYSGRLKSLMVVLG